MAIDVYDKVRKATEKATVGDVLKKVGGAVSDPIGTITKGATDVLDTAVDALADAFGIGKGADDEKYRKRQNWQRLMLSMAQGGDPIALDVLGAIGRQSPLDEEVAAPYAPEGHDSVPAGWTSAKWGEAYSKLIDRAARGYQTLAGKQPGKPKPPSSGGGDDGSWDGSTGTAPPAGPPSPPPTPPGPTTSAPPPTGTTAPSAPSGSSANPCPPDSQGRPRELNPATGRCRLVKARRSPVGSTASGFATLPQCPEGKEWNPKTKRCVKPCAYGRNPVTGRCNPKPRAAKKSRYQAKLEQKAARELAAAGEKAMAALGGPAGAAKLAAKAGLVAAAGLAAYYVTKKLLQLRYKTYDELRYEASNAYRAARQETAAKAGRPLTPEELKQLATWYKAKIAHLNEAEAAGKKVGGVVNLIFDEDK